MSSRDPSAPRREEIIVPIRVRTAPAGSQTAVRRHPRRIGVASALLLIAALTAGGFWWIGHLSRHPLEAPPAVPQTEVLPTPPLPAAQTTSETQQPSPQPRPAEAEPASPAASQGGEQAEAVRLRLASAER